MTTRRSFVATAGAGAAGVLVGCQPIARAIPGAIIGASSAAGHRLREGNFPEPREEIETAVVIAGGGIAGLAAARALDRGGVRDFLLLDLEAQPGGNAACGRNAVSAYPWGAHYVPLVNDEATDVLALFEELGIIRGRDASGAPIYAEEMLCADPMERLFDAGRWQDGLLPEIDVTPTDRAQYSDFFRTMREFRDWRGDDERPAFAIPLDLSSEDDELLAFDTITMDAWMTERGWNSAPLRWHVDYCCRDDYGAGLAHISAWAGIHYFASRRGRAANAASDAVVTWPEGNGWLAQKLAAPLGRRLRTRALVFRIAATERGVAVDFLDLATERSIRIHARAAVCALPHFIAQRIVTGLAPAPPPEYSPWMVANVTLDALPEGHGVALAWDNVPRDSRSLGYVVATHQHVHPVPHATVLTHYWPLDAGPPAAERTRALARTHREWCDIILADLERMHAGLTAHVRNIDVWLWGHGMVRPVPGFIWGETRKAMREPAGPIVFAHSDLSGLSIFEEAFTRGTTAARTLLARLST